MRSIQHNKVDKVEHRFILPNTDRQAMLSFETPKSEYTFVLNNQQAKELRDWMNRQDFDSYVEPKGA